ncbi:MAG: nuclear transport factor 2 family protein [Nitriliruptoraceae bacterium]
MDVATWVENYRVAWERADVALVVSLFAEDGTYRNDIFADPNVGHEGVAEYWAGVTSRQSDVEVQMGTPFVDGNRVAVEFWTKMALDGDDVTISGTLLLSWPRTAAAARCARTSTSRRDASIRRRSGAPDRPVRRLLALLGRHGGLEPR